MGDSTPFPSPAAIARAELLTRERFVYEGETLEASEEEVEVEDPGLEPGEEIEEEDFASDGEDPMIDDSIEPGEAEGVLEEDEA